MQSNKIFEVVETKPGLSPLFLLVLTADLFVWVHKIYIIGIILTVFTIIAFFKTSGFILDKDNRRVKKITGYSGIKYGKWYKLPEIKYISLLRIKQASDSNNGSTVVQNSPKSYGYQVNLVVQVHKERRPFKLMTTTVENAKSEGVKLGEFLDLKVFDSTTHHRYWIK